jgi:hypothetical protein
MQKCHKYPRESYLIKTFQIYYFFRSIYELCDCLDKYVDLNVWEVFKAE